MAWNEPGLHAAVFGNGASGAVIFVQNSPAERFTPASYVSLPKVTRSGTMAIPSSAAFAGSKPDAESATMATRPTGEASLCPLSCLGFEGSYGRGERRVALPGRPGRARGSRPDRPATLRRHGSIAVGRAGRHLHASLQHRPHRRDAD